MLDAFSTTFGNTVTLLIKSFRLSSLFPALCFVLVHCLIFISSVEKNLPAWLKDGGLGLPILTIFLLTAFIGYILNYLNYPLIYLAEGYPFRDTPWGELMRWWYRCQRDKLERQARIEGSEESFYKDKLSDHFPPNPTRCAPTDLGNVTAAFEAYPSHRYGIDAVYLWPRILPVLNEQKYAVFVEREKEGFDFFINLTALSAILMMECVLIRCLLGWPVFTWVALTSGCAVFIFYQAAVWCALNWGEAIKTAFDLYRYQLAEQMSLLPFKDKKDETRRWKALSYFIKRYNIKCDDPDIFGAFRYPLPTGKESQVESKKAPHEPPSEETAKEKEEE